VVPSAVAQRIIVKSLTNLNVKTAQILKRLGAQIGHETLSSIQVYDCSKIILKRTEERWITCEDYTICWETYSQRLLGLSRILFIYFCQNKEPLKQLTIRNFLKIE
jgi:hypothetical protein